MGGKIDIQNIQNGPEPIADLLIESSKLKGITLNTKLVANMIDEMPAFFIAASLAEGTTIVKDAEELRAKESDRLEAMANALGSLGVKFKLNQDGIVIHGLGDKGQFKASKINSLGDHRIAMASSIASLRADGEVRIVDCDNVGTSFPDFIEVCGDIGIKIKEQ
jgi:3-phosphoshikimate 1-carboxyvinyltransferase